MAQAVKNPPAVWESRVRSLGQEDSLEGAWQPTPVFLPGESHGQRSLAGYSSWGHTELGTTEQLTPTFTRKKSSRIFTGMAVNLEVS